MNKKLLIVLIISSLICYSKASDYLDTFEAHQGPVGALEIFEEFGVIITGGAFDKLIKVWDLNTHAFKFQLTGHEKGIWSLSKFSYNDKRYLISTSQDKTIKLWNLATKQLVRTFKGHTETVNKAIFIPNLDLIVSTGMDKTIKIWDAKKGGQPIREINDAHQNWVRGLLYIPKSDGIVASASYDKTVKIWDIKTGELLQELFGHESDIYGFNYHETRNELISCDNKGNILRWNWLEGTFKVVQQDESGFFAIGVATIPNSNIIFTAGYNSHNIQALDMSILNQKTLYEKVGHVNENWNVVYRRGTGFIYSGSTDYSVKKWSVCQFEDELFDLQRGICVKQCEQGDVERRDLNACVQAGKKTDL